ncbi:MAG: 2-oxoacid:acceptor oxidoreductase subunit alpha [Candidatus Omnitrophica bacterium]|nr:2-oxoacid:acceptor oxidoreductase subunit alpha [Candidatus Omnitrophota bacterium]
MSKVKQEIDAITVRFAGDSGDGMQLAGDQFTDTTAIMGNDFSTLPDFPAEIRAPVGTLPGVSSFQIQFSNSVIFTPGDDADVLVAMNPAALKVNLINVRKGGLVIVNSSSFTEMGLKKANWQVNPLEDATLKDFKVLKVPLSELTKNALKEHPLKMTEVERCKNFFALGMMFWLYDRSLEHTITWINKKFSKRQEMAAANISAVKAGYNYADITETLPTQFVITKSKLDPGTYRKIMGNEAAAIGLITAARLAKKTLFYGSYPITPASDILHYLATQKHFGVKTFQAEDEIAAIGSIIGAAFGGHLGVTGTSGPGMCLKAEALNLAIMAELPLILIDVQRGGPSTGMPTKTEQGDLLQAIYGRNGESPVAVVAPKTPADCFDMAIEAVRIAFKYMTPVIYLSEGYLSSSSEPWKLPDISKLPDLTVKHPVADPLKKFLPYERDAETLARPWATPGTPGLEHRIGGLSKADLTGNVSYDPENNQRMIDLRAEKIRRIALDIPDLEVRGPKSGKILVLGWGGTYGALYQSIDELCAEGLAVAHAHLSYLNPFPKNLGHVLRQYEKVIVPELNMGQLIVLLRYQYPEVKFVGINKVKGHPFKILELKSKIKEYL